jgi:hypothetical protein
VESEAAAVLGYVNRPTGHVPERGLEVTAAGQQAGHRSAMRIARVALRAYEQRAISQARMRVWLLARASTSASAAGSPGAIGG